MSDDRVVIVTGAGRGLGRGAALAFANTGCRIGVLEIDADTGADTAREIEGRGGRAIAVGCDVGDKPAVERAVAQVVEAFGRIDVVINNAQAVRFNTVLETTDEDAEVMWRSGFLGTLHVMQAAHPHLVVAQGVIINVISGAMLGGFGKSGVYGAVKAAIRTLTRSAAVEWGPIGVRVNCISPSARTPALEVWAKEFPEAYKQRTSIIPLQRFGDPEDDIGRALVALASPDAHYITSATVTVDGGAYFL